MEVCRSGRTGLPAKQLISVMGFEGSNPSTSANLPKVFTTVVQSEGTKVRKATEPWELGKRLTQQLEGWQSWSIALVLKTSELERAPRVRISLLPQ